MTPTPIRPMAPPDIAAVLEMVHALAAHHGDAATLDAATLQRDAAQWMTVLVAEGETGLLGYAVLCPLIQLQFGARGLDLHHLFVRDNQRGRGVGRALIDASIAHARRLDCRFVVVGTHPENVQAGEVYRAVGFEERPVGGARFRMVL